MRYLGVDLHTNNFTVCFFDEDGTQTFEKYQLKEFDVFKSKLQSDDHIAVEATGNSRFFHSHVLPLVAECVVVNAGQFGVIKQSVSKTDRNDARALAQFLCKGLLPSSRVKDELHAQINSLAQTRDLLVNLHVHSQTRSWNPLCPSFFSDYYQLSAGKQKCCVVTWPCDYGAGFHLP